VQRDLIWIVFGWFVVGALLRAMSIWFAVNFTPLGVGARTFQRYDVQCDLIWIVFGWFVVGALLRGYRGEHP